MQSYNDPVQPNRIPPQGYRVRRPAHPLIKRKKRTDWVVIGLLAAFTAALLPWLLLLSSYLFFQISGLILPGVHLGDLSLGGMTPSRASQVLNRTWNQNSTLTVSDGEQIWYQHAYDYGLWLDADQTSNQAYQIGRQDARLWTYIETLFYGREIPPIVLFLPDYANLQMETMRPIVSRPPEENHLSYENGRWVLTQGQPGKELDIAASLTTLAAHSGDILYSQQLLLITRPIFAQSNLEEVDLESILDQLNRPLNISAYDPIKDETIQWSVSPAEFAPWIQINTQSESKKPTVSIDSAHFIDYLTQWERSLAPDRALQKDTIPTSMGTSWQRGKAIKLTIQQNPTNYTVQAGDTLESIGELEGLPYWKILDANPGLSLNQLNAGQQINIPSKNEMLPLPVVRNKRIIISLSQQRLWTYENGQQRSEHVISSGIASSPTHPGVFQVQTHDEDAYASVWDLYMPHFLGIYEGWPGFMNGIHGLPTLSNGTRLWANVLGRPASYGCIILNLSEAEDLYTWAENGVVVEIQP